MKRVLTIFIFLMAQTITAQCAMCKAVVESGDAEVAESLNTGILYLMAFPYVLAGIGAYFLYKNWKKLKL